MSEPLYRRVIVKLSGEALSGVQDFGIDQAMVERLRREGFAGATVFHGVAGFGAHSVMHTSNILRLSQDLPVVIEVVDTQEQVDRMIPILDEMVSEGLVTMEKVRVHKYATRPA